MDPFYLMMQFAAVLIQIAGIVVQVITIIVLTATAFLIFLQYRKEKKPQLQIEIKPNRANRRAQRPLEQQIGEDAAVGSNDFFLFIRNITNETAEEINVSYSVELENEEYGPITERFNIPYLHASEETRRPFPLDRVVAGFQEWFEEVNMRKRQFTVPKKTLNLYVNVSIQYNGITGYKTEDEFVMEWVSLGECQDKKKHPLIICWNMRGGNIIRKNAEQKIQAD